MSYPGSDLDLLSSIRYHSRMVAYPRFRSSRDILIREGAQRGLSVSDLARAARLSQSWVRKIVKVAL